MKTIHVHYLRMRSFAIVKRLPWLAFIFLAMGVGAAELPLPEQIERDLNR
ncbi:MAG: hypothetical protein H0X66_20625 [Verrucomicrobia bacterium]|nr:hypothetical protein [Verrucomicrobiota bacterium]